MGEYGVLPIPKKYQTTSLNAKAFDDTFRSLTSSYISILFCILNRLRSKQRVNDPTFKILISSIHMNYLQQTIGTIRSPTEVTYYLNYFYLHLQFMQWKVIQGIRGSIIARFRI